MWCTYAQTFFEFFPANKTFKHSNDRGPLGKSNQFDMDQSLEWEKGTTSKVAGEVWSWGGGGGQSFVGVLDKGENQECGGEWEETHLKKPNVGSDYITTILKKLNLT